jgi:hypothetical protein
MKDEIIKLAQYPFYIWLLALAVGVIICTGAYFFWYHVIKYPNGKPKKK